MQRLMQQGQQPGRAAPPAYAPANPQPGPSRLQQRTAAPSRGGEPTALVESESGAAGVELMDYVYPGQVIDLGAKGSITLAHFESCVTETIRGGRVTVGEGHSEVSGGKLSAKETPCQGAKPIITAEASEAGAAAKRFGKGGGPAEREFILKSGQPVFKWEGPSGQATELAVYLDGRQSKLLWRQSTKARHLSYPASAPKLEAGEAYRVEATLPDGRKLAALFSIDPGLEIADNPANRLVALGP
jgi:hypothetical protein